MALELVGGAALGAVFGELLKEILDAREKISEFKYDVDRLKFTLEFIISRKVEIEELDKKLNYPKTSDIDRLIEELDKAKDLIRKCSKVERNLVKKRLYSDELKKLNDSLERFFSLNVNVEFWSKRILVNLQEANEKFAPLNLIERSVESGNVDPKLVLDNLQDVSGKLDQSNLIETSVGSGNVDQKQVLVNLPEVGRKLNLIERSVERGNMDQKRVLAYLQELSGKLDQSNLMETSVGNGNVDQKQVLVHLQEVSRKLDQLNLIETSVGGRNVDQNEYRCAIPEIPNFSVGMDVRIEELKMELFRDDVSMIGLCALSGSGKTTLAAKLCRDEQVKEKFKDNIIFLTVSSLPDFKVIVEGIFKRLGVGNQLMKFQNDEDAEKQLKYLMKQKEEEPILLVLDDVCEESFLEKFVFGTARQKILVTSRTEYKSFDFTYSLKMLNDLDSMSLFRCLAFPQDGSYEMPDEDCVKQIVRGCKGVPLILKVIARSLRGEPARKWKSIEKTLGKGSSIFDIEKDHLECLATCLDFLDDNVRECFLDLGSFSEDQRIPASVLIDIWAELYELDEDKAYVNLLELSSRNLINLLDESVGKDAGKIDGNFNELFVTQHDILRDLAIYKSRDRQDINKRKRLMMDQRKDKIPKSREQDDQPFDACLVSIQTDEMLSSGWIKMQFPKVKVLIISRVYLENEQFQGSDLLGKLKTSSTGILNRKFILPMVVKKMSNLKVLIISNCESHDPELIELSSLDHLSQLKILRLEKTMYPSLNKIIKPLKNLQKISLVECTFRLGWTFDNISHIFPNLLEIDINYCYNLKALPQRICKIRHLKKLSVTGCSYLTELPEQIGDLTELEVLRLCGCMNLIDLPDSIRRLGKLRFLDISACTDLQRMPEGLGELCSLRKLNMRRCSSVRRLPRSAMDLRCLKNVISDEEMGILWKALAMGLPDLNIQVD